MIEQDKPVSLFSCTLTLHYFYARLLYYHCDTDLLTLENVQMTSLGCPPLGPLPWTSVKITFDGQEFGGFALTLRQVLKTLGVPTEQMKYTFSGKPSPDGLIEGYVVTHLEIPASTTLPTVPAFTEMTVEDSKEEGLQEVSLHALRTLMRRNYEQV